MLRPKRNHGKINISGAQTLSHKDATVAAPQLPLQWRYSWSADTPGVVRGRAQMGAADSDCFVVLPVLGVGGARTAAELTERRREGKE